MARLSDVIEFLIESKRKDLVDVLLEEIRDKKTIDRLVAPYPISPVTVPSPNPLIKPYYIGDHHVGTRVTS